jgi:hypothetical protein
VEIPKLLRDFQARWKSPAPWDFSSERLLPPTASPTNSAIEPFNLRIAKEQLVGLIKSQLGLGEEDQLGGDRYKIDYTAVAAKSRRVAGVGHIA